ncbi:unnamed protein product [Trifolium pratense]|uniref:Uncharacterized protein n=1 Tax=Trifolium pratense TaxID=57577 RepID=A0ACB0K6F1_TRIPR|nr:unnamed protein product [Trifolium pratense]
MSPLHICAHLCSAANQLVASCRRPAMNRVFHSPLRATLLQGTGLLENMKDACLVWQLAEDLLRLIGLSCYN